MSIMQVRGGVPSVFRETVGTGGRKHNYPFAISFLKVKVLTNPCRLYFREQDFDADENYVLLDADGEWDGPVEGITIWLRGVGGNAEVEAVGFQRRG
jgi:hypothetical protein